VSTPLPKDPRDWPLERKLEYAMDRAEKLIDRRPVLAETWLRAADLLRAKISAQMGSTDKNSG